MTRLGKGPKACWIFDGNPSGGTYSVRMWKDGSMSCDCSTFVSRSTCRHVTRAKRDFEERGAPDSGLRVLKTTSTNGRSSGRKITFDEEEAS